MLTLSSIEPEMNGVGRYRAVTRELFHAKTAYFRQLNARKRVPFHPGKQHSSGQLHGAVSSDKQLGRYLNNGVLITEVKAISLSTRYFLHLDQRAWVWCTTDR